ncbi:protein-cysteine N-palmitoyltransferase HHAT-like [Uloborus diversus]|uniref:protein-cysteine N-palmitoyltransferase HHAT-like n=1 Tax=Uloborus diversus TaxID=327109 RepID=UPI002409E4E4|nr:protein-cysteine N-palmitoyltransferase HHAT-like [Uloborus diversus]XP_054718025.1 protein-cysteine N-palmitoyltransferase HHAT-like [Uloborus diversus]XP_054718026.1 protein-cysteine N-palmitoyltransferase HHAT-like [Uloborus diversus]
MEIEKHLYWLVWVGSVFYSLWTFIGSCKQHYNELDSNDFKEDWFFLESKDNSDIEWNILTSLFKKYWFLLVLQLICSHVISKKHKAILPLFYAIYSMLCLFIIVGLRGSLLYVIHIMLMVILHMTGRKHICYLFTVTTLLILHSTFITDIKTRYFPTESHLFIFEVGFGWLLIKCLSFAVDSIESGSNKNITIQELSSVFSYCFYLPTVFTGPILCYTSFKEQVMQVNQQFSAKQYLSKVFHLLYFFLWYLVFELLLHFVYSSAVQYHPELCSTFTSWALCGLGYALPMMFYLKYFIIYGITARIAELEDIECPPPPRCITAIHSSSFLYRHFDRGLYFWILRYLYYPVIKGSWSASRKLCGLFISFAFVCMWHGMEKPVCMWTFLNFILVSTEMTMKPFLCVGDKNYFQKKGFSSLAQKRLSALCGTMHFIMMCISCTFFLSNWDIGMLLLKRVMLTGWIPFLPIAFIMYCGCHVSMDVLQHKASSENHLAYSDNSHL